jgi:hypothetical protein
MNKFSETLTTYNAVLAMIDHDAEYLTPYGVLLWSSL